MIGRIKKRMLLRRELMKLIRNHVWVGKYRGEKVVHYGSVPVGVLLELIGEDKDDIGEE